MWSPVSSLCPADGLTCTCMWAAVPVLSQSLKKGGCGIEKGVWWVEIKSSWKRERGDNAIIFHVHVWNSQKQKNNFLITPCLSKFRLIDFSFILLSLHSIMKQFMVAPCTGYSPTVFHGHSLIFACIQFKSHLKIWKTKVGKPILSVYSCKYSYNISHSTKCRTKIACILRYSIGHSLSFLFAFLFFCSLWCNLGWKAQGEAILSFTWKLVGKRSVFISGLIWKWSHHYTASLASLVHSANFSATGHGSEVPTPLKKWCLIPWAGITSSFANVEVCFCLSQWAVHLKHGISLKELLKKKTVHI